MTKQYEEIGNIIENASIIYKNQLIFEEGSSLSIQFLSQETIAKKVKIKPHERKKQEQD